MLTFYRPLVFKATDLVKDDQELVRRNKDPIARPLVRRPAYGKAGSLHGCRTNFFSIDIGDAIIYLYAIKINPEVRDKRKKRQLVTLFEKEPRFRVYSEKTAMDFPGDHIVSKEQLTFDVRVDYETVTKVESYTFSFHELRKISTTEVKEYAAGRLPGLSIGDLEHSVTALNIILAKFPRSNIAMMTIGKHKYFPTSDNKAMYLSNGIDCIRGFFTSLRTLNHGLTLNVNICTSAFTSHRFDLLGLMDRWAGDQNPAIPLATLCQRKDPALIAFITGLHVRSDHQTRGKVQLLTVHGLTDQYPGRTKYLNTQELISARFQRRTKITPFFFPLALTRESRC